MEPLNPLKETLSLVMINSGWWGVENFKNRGRGGEGRGGEGRGGEGRGREIARMRYGKEAMSFSEKADTEIRYRVC